MSEIVKIETEQQVLEAVQWAVSNKKPMEVRGRGTKQGLGRPVQADHVLDMSGLTGILDYQPSELFISAAAGTPIAEIIATLHQQNQQLMFEPPDYGPLLGGEAGLGTLGGMMACNLAGPRRLKSGAARDNFLGFHAVSGRGEEFKSGGKVVKNVTGFDLSKLITGSYGTLAVVTEATFKVLPSPEKTRTVVIQWDPNGVYDYEGAQAMTEAMVSTNEVSAAAHLPAAIAERSGVDYVGGCEGAVTAVRVEGPGPSVDYRCAALMQLFSKFGKVEELHSQNSKTLWKEIADVAFFIKDQDRALWRISVPPTEGSQVVQRILDGQAGDAFYDWAGGLVWLQLDQVNNASEGLVRKSVGEVGGHATLVRASQELRSTVRVFPPLDEGLAAITKRVKAGFDPQGILNPARMYEGI